MPIKALFPLCVLLARELRSLCLSRVVPGNMTFRTSNVDESIVPAVCFGTFIAASIRRECARTFKFKLGSATDESLQKRESKPEAQFPNTGMRSHRASLCQLPAKLKCRKIRKAIQRHEHRIAQTALRAEPRFRCWLAHPHQSIRDKRRAAQSHQC